MKTAALLLLAFAAFLVAAEPSLEISVPPRWYAVPGVPMSLYYDNIVLTGNPADYRFEITCDIGKAEARRWTVTPANQDTGDHSMRVTVKDASGRALAQAQTVLHVARRDAGANRTLRLLIVGDSLTHATIYPNELARLLGGAANPKWTMLGTHRPTSAAPGVAHEGYGGWKWNDFLTKFDPKPAGVTAGPTARKSSSPFIYADAAGKGTLDIPRYLRDECGGQPPDVVTFLLGINDCFGANPDDRDAMARSIDTVLDHADKLLAAFHTAAPRAILAVGLTTPPNSREEAFVANYQGKYHRWGWKRIQHRLVQRMQQRLAGREAQGIHLVPTHLNLDPIDGYPPNNGVHPNAAGYAQIAATFHAWLKTWMEK